MGVMPSNKEWVEKKKHKKDADALKKIRTIREQVLQKTTELSDEEAYQLAGFGKQATEEILRAEQLIVAKPKSI